MTYVKICGIKSIDDAFAAINAGADYLGFNFYPNSIRHIEPAACKKIAAILKTTHPSIRLVGVFVNSPVCEIQSILKECSLDLVQMHGDETPEMLAQLGTRAFKAFREMPENFEGFIQSHSPAFLIDASTNGSYGVTGQLADWSEASTFTQQHSFFLAGGLTPDNVADAIRQVHPWGVDVASGVESTRGIKDATKMRSFINAVHQTTYPGLIQAQAPSLFGE